MHSEQSLTSNQSNSNMLQRRQLEVTISDDRMQGHQHVYYLQYYRSHTERASQQSTRSNHWGRASQHTQ